MRSNFILFVLIGVLVLTGALGVALVMGVFGPHDSGESIMEQLTESIARDDNPSAITLVAQAVSGTTDGPATLRVPEGFEVAVAAEGLGKARFMTMSPDGRLFVPDMVDYNLSGAGRLIILDGFDEETKQFATQTTYLSSLRGPNSVEFYTDDEGRDWLYLALTEHIVRYPYTAGDTEPSGEGEVIHSFPNEQSGDAVGVVWHITRTMVFHEDVLYVSVGSGCNACEQPEGELRAMILAMDADGENVRVYADGLKNAVGIGFVNDVLYATDNGVDHLGNEAPDDLMFRVEDGEHYGWPYCYEERGEKRFDDIPFWNREPIDCTTVPMSFAAFQAHSAPLGFAYFGPDAHATLRSSFLVALQGSWDSTLGQGYRVVRISPDGTQDVFLDGFFTSAEERPTGQPVHILPTSGNAFFLTDDLGGRIYYVSATN